MKRALELAKNCSVLTSPNPKVGCVIVKNGQIVGEGFTQPVGGNHAEIEALNDAAGRGELSGSDGICHAGALCPFRTDTTLCGCLDQGRRFAGCCGHGRSEWSGCRKRA